MPRTHGYSEIGKRCYGMKDWHAKGRTNVIGAITDNEFITTCLFDANIDSDIFSVWLKKDLLPKLPSHSIIVLDNASFHKRLDAKKIVKAAGHVFEYLPPYSPDLNPIEHKWNEAKAKRRETYCSVYDLFQDYIPYRFILS
jgi:transposase